VLEVVVGDDAEMDEIYMAMEYVEQVGETPICRRAEASEGTWAQLAG